MRAPGEWKCDEGCDVTTSICSHIEATLPECSDRSWWTLVSDTENSTASYFAVMHPTHDPRGFENLLDTLHVDKDRRVLLELIYCAGYSTRRIAGEYRMYGSSSTVSRAHKDILARLRMCA